MTPDKIYCMHRLNGDYSCSTTPFGGSVEYIRKDALLEWVNDNLLECKVSNDDADYGRIDAYKKLIDKINSL